MVQTILETFPPIVVSFFNLRQFSPGLITLLTQGGDMRFVRKLRFGIRVCRCDPGIQILDRFIPFVNLSLALFDIFIFCTTNFGTVNPPSF